MIFFKEKTREYIVSYEIISGKLNRRGLGHTVRIEKGNKFTYADWHEETVKYWNEKWNADDVSIIVTNIFENK